MSRVRVLEIPQEILDSARLTPSELMVEMAVHLYTQGRLPIGKARELADMTLWEFRQLLASRRIPPHYHEADLDEDVATVRGLGRLGQGSPGSQRESCAAPESPTGSEAAIGHDSEPLV